MKSKVYFSKTLTSERVIDLYKALGVEHFMERVSSRHGEHTLEAANELGFGSIYYELVSID